MSTLSKSRVARSAFAVATKVLRPYAHKFSPKLFTQPQLFVCLVLKGFTLGRQPQSLQAPFRRLQTTRRPRF